MLKNPRKIALFGGLVAALAAGIFLACRQNTFSSGAEPQAPAVPQTPPPLVTPHKPKYVRGLHLTAWVAGSPKLRAAYDRLCAETEVNTLVIDLKEYEGEVYIPGVKQAEQAGTFVNAIPDLAQYVADLKKRGIYTIARIVVFKDNKAVRKRPDLAVKNPDGGTWKDRRGNTWLDPYNHAAWDYNLAIAERALELGFEEIQFDYIRFPSDGNVRACRYSQRHSTGTSIAALEGFLKEAHDRLKPKGANISIDVFGLTTTVAHDMGIGQRIVEMAKYVDYVSPMVYPSHYNPGEYGIPNPDAAPYRTVYLGMEGAVWRLGGTGKLRPWLQDFSLKHRYGAKEVRDQIQATYDNDIGEWLLWNPRCAYTRGALKDKRHADNMEKSPVIPRDGKPVSRRHSIIVSSTTVTTSTAPAAETASPPAAN